ncbi:MAG: hypothetical protein P8J32_07295 [bacterium]|nr:hypothetical protein [bacterium]
MNGNRDITRKAIARFMTDRKFTRPNTAVEVLPNVTILTLHGNEIAFRYNDPKRTLSITNDGWFTNVTRERLNGIPGVSIHQRNFQWYLNDEKWNGELVDINKNGEWAYVSSHNTNRE